MTVVAVNHLTKSYKAVTAVNDLSFTAASGEIVALVGPDGAGKTTLFRSLCGLIDFDAGEASIAGFDVSRQFDQVKPHLGYMPQTFSLYPDLSVEENLRFYAGLFGLARDQFTRKTERLYQFSNLGPFAKRRAGQLSGGMKQKLALSCALIHDPKVLVLDEPTTGVDPLSRRQFWGILKSLRDDGSTIVISTPYMDEVALADRAILIHGGRKMAEGTPAELVGLYRGQVYLVKTEPTSERMTLLATITGIDARRFGAAIHLYAPLDMPRDRLLERLAGADIDPALVEPIPPELEDVFIQLMGAA